MSEEWDETDSAAQDRSVARQYIIEHMPLVDKEKQYEYMAFRQDYEGWSTKWDRALLGGNNVEEVLYTMKMHFPGSICVGYIPEEIEPHGNITEPDNDSSEEA